MKRMRGEFALHRRRHLPVVTFVFWGLLMGCLIGLIGWLALTAPLAPIEFGRGTLGNDHVEATDSEPVFLRIPSVGIAAPFGEPLGVDSNQEIEVPTNYAEVAYYKFGPKPGALGPAVVLGHVDSYRGPAIFYDLKDVAPGELIEIERADGSVAIFSVERLETHEQAGFPTTAVYGDIDYAGLRLITCTGVYSHGTQRYSHNLIVFAQLVEVQLPPDTMAVR